MKTIVFDFDKTLTNYDTLTDFFKRQIKHNSFLIIFYYILKCFSKLNIISIKKEKEIMLSLLLKNHDDVQLFTDFAKTIKLNDVEIKLKEHLSNGDKVIILSASPEIYLKLLFPNCYVYGMKYKRELGKIHITQHPYGKDKPKVLIENGIQYFDKLYYDSSADEYLIPMCIIWNKISHGLIIETQSK